MSTRITATTIAVQFPTRTLFDASGTPSVSSNLSFADLAAHGAPAIVNADGATFKLTMSGGKSAKTTIALAGATFGLTQPVGGVKAELATFTIAAFVTGVDTSNGTDLAANADGCVGRDRLDTRNGDPHLRSVRPKRARVRRVDHDGGTFDALGVAQTQARMSFGKISIRSETSI